MEELLEYRRDILSALVDVVLQLDQVTAVIPRAAWHIPGEIDGYTPHFILSRLLLLERQVYSVNIRRIIEENSPLLSRFDEGAWLQEHYASTMPAESVYHEFARLRMSTVSWLRDLPRQDWNRTGRHPWWGERTLQWWVERQLDDSRRHLEALGAIQPL